MGVPGIGEAAHGIARAGGGVKVDERGTARRLGVAVSHPDGHTLVQGEDVPEVGRETLQERKLVRAGIAEDGGDVVMAE